MKLNRLITLLFLLPLSNLSAQDDSLLVKKLKYQITTRDLIEKSKSVDDQGLKAILASQAITFSKKYGLEEELWGELYPLAYDGLQGILAQIQYDKSNYSLTKEEANRISDSAYNQYQAHFPTSKVDRWVAARSVHLTKDGKSFYSAGGDGKVQKWNIASRTSELVFQSKSVNRVVDISADEKWAAIASNDNEIGLLDLTVVKKELIPIKSHRGPLVDLVFLPDNSGYVTVGIDRQVLQSDFQNSSLITTIEPTPTSLAISPDSHTLVIGSRRGELLLIDRQQNSENIHNIFHDNLDEESIEAIAFSTDGRYLAFGGTYNQTGHGYIHIWDRESKNAYGPKLEGFTSGLTDITFSEEGTYMAASSRDYTTRVWRMSEDGIYNLPIVLDDHQGWVWDANFHPDNQRLFTACADGIVRVFDLTIDHLQSQLCPLLPRELSPLEWRTFVGKIEEYPMEPACQKEE